MGTTRAALVLVRVKSLCLELLVFMNAKYLAIGIIKNFEVLTKREYTGVCNTVQVLDA